MKTPNKMLAELKTQESKEKKETEEWMKKNGWNIFSWILVGFFLVMVGIGMLVEANPVWFLDSWFPFVILFLFIISIPLGLIGIIILIINFIRNKRNKK